MSCRAAGSFAEPICDDARNILNAALAEVEGHDCARPFGDAAADGVRGAKVQCFVPDQNLRVKKQRHVSEKLFWLVPPAELSDLERVLGLNFGCLDLDRKSTRLNSSH